MSDVIFPTSDIIQTTSDLFCAVANLWETKHYIAPFEIRQNTISQYIASFYDFCGLRLGKAVCLAMRRTAFFSWRIIS